MARDATMHFIRWYARHHVKLGVIGLSITLVLNLLDGARPFTADWWSRWFLSYVVWLIVLLLGVKSQPPHHTN